VFTGSVFAQQKAFLTAEEILAAWEKNYGSLNSLEVECAEKVVSAVPGSDPNFDYMARDMIKYIEIHRTDQGDKFYCSTTVLRKPGELVTNETSFDGIEQREYTAESKTGMIFPKLQETTLAIGNLIDCYLLRRKVGKEKLPEFKNLFETARLHPDQVTIGIRPFLEEVNGQMCHVVVYGETGNVNKIIWVAHERNMLPMKYQVMDRTKDTATYYVEDGVEVLEIGFAKTDNGGLWYPKKARRIDCMPSYYTVTFEIEVSKFIPNVACDPNIFRMAFPNGTRVFDTRINESYVIGTEE
jgi:hypothetical protein